MKQALYWKGDPLFYHREEGHGLIIGGYHYQFTPEGSLESAQGITEPVLRMVLSQIYPHPEQAMAAHARRSSGRQTQEANDEGPR
jgi:phosphoribosylformylglycinamidine (FGAM) synthase-like amidotransferase family enzyme